VPAQPGVREAAQTDGPGSAPPRKTGPDASTPAPATAAAPESPAASNSDSADQPALPSPPATFTLTPQEQEQIAAVGLRQHSGRHVTVISDLADPQPLEELAQTFDAAVPLWCRYFEVDPAKVATWRVAACLMHDKSPFVRCGLYPEDLPPFPHGYSRGAQLWIYEQPSDYYRRHLLLHEGTHIFMQQCLQGAGPPWYMEGIAEYLATHRWENGQLTLAVMPRTKEEFPYWGRVKIIRDETAAARALTLNDIMNYDAQAHLRNEPYGWCWAAVAFLDQHPQSQAAFRELQKHTAEEPRAFNRRLQEGIGVHWPAVQADWQVFVAECDYGYDVARAAAVHLPPRALPPEGTSVRIAADRGWQSTGLRLEAGRSYFVTARGQYLVARSPRPWPCEPDGVTIEYHRGQPLGKLLYAIVGEPAKPADGTAAGESAKRTTPLASPQPLGAQGQIVAAEGGTLYLKINEAASGLADNEGELSVEIQPLPAP